MKSAPSAPPAPDYQGAAVAQGQANKEAAMTTGVLANPNIYSPYGMQQVSYDPTGPDGMMKPTVTQTLNPQSQAIFDRQQQVRMGLADLSGQGLGTAQQVLGTQFNPYGASGGAPSTGKGASTMPAPPEPGGGSYNPYNTTTTQDMTGGSGTPGSISNLGAAAAAAGGPASVSPNAGASGYSGYSANGGYGAPTDAGGVPHVQTGLNTYGNARMPINAGMTAQNALMSRLGPQLDRRRQALHTQLLNEGHVRGNEGYSNAMQDYGQTENDMLLQAGREGLGLDMAANQQGFNQALQGGQFANTAQQQAMAQALQLRTQPLNEITALMSGSQIQNPQFQGYTGAPVAPANYAGAAGQQGLWDQGIYNSQVGQANSGNNAMVGLASAAAIAF